MATATKQSRETITLVPYNWSAYNRVVGRGIGVYFARKWLRELKPVGAAIVQYLRSKCYANHQTGEYRYEVELDLVEIAEGIGVSLSTVKREFRESPWLAEFVQRQSQYEQINGTSRVKKVASLWFVSLDDPIHPDDIERYEAYLRDEGKPKPSVGKVVVRRPRNDKGQNDSYHNNDKGHFDPYQGQNDPSKGQNDLNSGQNDPYLPIVSYSSLPPSTSDTAALPPKPNGFPPEGKGALRATMLHRKTREPTRFGAGSSNPCTKAKGKYPGYRILRTDRCRELPAQEADAPFLAQEEPFLKRLYLDGAEAGDLPLPLSVPGNEGVIGDADLVGDAVVAI